MKSWFLNVAILLLATITYAQSGTVTGEVIDGEYNAPLMGANVLVKGTTHGVSTDMQGKFSLNVNAPTGTLEFSYLGYVTKTVPYKLVNGKAHIKVTLSTDQQALGEVVVTGFATKNKNSFTGAQVSIKKDELLAVGTKNVLTSLATFVPGMNILEDNAGGSDPNKMADINWVCVST